MQQHLINGSRHGIAEKNCFVKKSQERLTGKCLFFVYSMYKNVIMREGFIIRFLIFAFLLGSLYFLNPTKEQHFDKLKVKFNDAYTIDNGNDNAFESRFEFHNYYFFSTTTDRVGDEHERSTIGVLGIVF